MKFLIHKRAYFMRLLITIICIFTGMAILCTVLLSMIDYQQSSRERDILNNSRISFFRQNTDTQLNTALIQIETLRNDTNFAQFAISSSQEDAHSLGIYEKIQENQFLFDNLGISIGVIHPENGLCIMSDSYNRPDINSLDVQYEDLSLTRFTLLDIGGVIPMERGKTREGAIFMIRQRYLGSYDLVFLFLIYNINNLSVEDTDNFVLVYDDKTAYTSSSVPLPEGLLELDSGERHFMDYDVYQENSQVFPAIRYIYYTNAAAGVSVLRIIAVFSTVLLFGICLTFLVVRKLYNPIDSVVDSFEKVSGGGNYYDELEYMSGAVNRMHEDILRLKESDAEYHSLMCDEFLHNLLDGVLAEREIQEKLETLKMPLLEGKNILICVEMIGFGSQYQDMDNSMYKLIQNDLAEIFRDRIFAGEDTVYTVYMSGSRTVFIAPVGQYQHALEDLCAEIETDYEIDLIVAISKVVEDVYHMEKACHDAVYTIENGFFNADTYVIDAETFKGTANSDVYYPMEIEQKIIENMTMGEVENAISLVNKILDTNMENGLTSRGWTQMKFLFASTVNRILSQMNRTADEVFGEDTVLYLELSGKNKSMRKYKVLTVFETLGTYVRSEATEKSGQFEKMTEFIDQNLDKDVSLLDLAEHMGLSSSYVSKLFKTLAKQNFKTYVNKRRLEMAKEILRTEKDVKIAEVAARIGCNNTVTFTRMFKKYTGMTPSEFQK